MSSKKTIQELTQTCTPGVVQAIDGNVKFIDRVVSGVTKGSNFPYRFQSIIIEDDGFTMKVTYSGKDDFPFPVGTRICILGAEAKNYLNKTSQQNEFILYAGKNTTTVRVTDMQQPSATASPAPAQQPQTKQAPPVQQPPASKPVVQQAVHTNSPPPREPNKDASSEETVAYAEDYLQRVGNFYLLAMETAYYVRKVWDARHPEQPMTDAHFQGAVGGFCQGADRQFIPNKVPNGDIRTFLDKYHPQG